MRKLLFLITVLTFGHSAYSQGYGGYPRYYIGANVFGGGTMIANQNNYGLPEPNYKPSFAVHAGLVGGVCFTDRHQLQVEVNYAGLQQNYKDNFQPYTKAFELTKQVTLRYVQVPILYRFVFTNAESAYGDGGMFYINAGLQLGYLAQMDLKYQMDNLQVTWDSVQTAFYYQTGHKTPAPEYASKLYQKFTLDFVGGTGWEKFITDNIRLGVEFRAYISLTDINSDEKNPDGSYKWRIPKPGDTYSASRNFAGGVRVLLSYFFD